MQGQVKWFSPEKGFGFISSSDGGVFLHWKQIRAEGFKMVEEGDKVAFEVRESAKGLSAEDVRVIQ